MAIWSLKGKKVLIIDDFQEMLFMLRSMIAPLNPDLVLLAKNGEEAIEHMEETKFDVVFCDYNLGKGKDGQQILEEARHRNLLPYSSIYIMVTAENTSDMVMGAIEYLPDDYISKPFNRTVIHTRLRKQLEKKENLSDISQALAAKNYRKVIQLCDSLLANKPANRLDLLKIKGEQLSTLGEYEKAADLYEDIIEERDIPWAYLSLGKVRYFQKDYDEAIAVLKGLVNENPSNVSAYDWLAKTYEALEDLGKAEEMLTIGISKSPKSLLRQRNLAQLAYKNDDLETAESAYKKAIDIGKYSCYKNTDDYTSLAKTLIDSDKSDDAANIADLILRDFENNANAEMVAAITNSMISKHNGDTNALEKSLETALELIKHHPQGLSSDAALELTSLCLTSGKEEQAKEITKNLIKNNHENKALIEKTKQIYSDANMSDIGTDLIDNATNEIIEINNEGARLLKDGKLKESIDLFMKAARVMPENVVVNLNTAYSIMMHMKKTGKVKKYSPRVSEYLERVNKADPSNKKYHELTEMLQQIIIKSNTKAA
ncbi:MAG: response regulator [Proteobacteria bacterium]|nr:response regulator [Pseudomonadota bacterium]NOG59250.1 response regulator [Pseudomonadota bacterium]